MRIVSALHTTQPLAFGADEPVSLERRLVERARAGDDQAFRAIFDRHAPSVRRFLYDLLRDRDAADEATQETFVRAHGRLAALRDQDKLVAWLFGIARHVFHEARRARRPPPLRPDAPGPEAVDQAPTPESALIGREADEVLGRAIARLSEERRAALLLRIDHGLEYDQIRGVMGWSLAKVKNEIHRARLELRASLAHYLGGEQ